RSFERVDLGDVAREVIELTRPRWEVEGQSRGVRYEFTVEGLAPPVAGRPEELREVLTNLITNAVDAMPEGGRCTVRLAAGLEWASVSVRDNGVGMAEDMRRRVFEPFFTSKGPRGTGLGLAVSWGIVTRHGGTIEVDSVLSDISMPGLSGWDVATQLRTRFPTIPIGFVTGWGDQLDPERLTRTGVSFVIAKPFQTLDVLRHVAQALTAPRPAA